MQLPVEEQLPACLALLRQDRIDEAAEVAGAMARERPHDPQTRFAMALVDRHRGKAESALATLERLTRELPQNPLIRLEYATTLVMTGRPDEAVPILSSMSAAAPGQMLPMFWLGQAHLRAFRGPDAVECFERVRQIAPQNQQAIQSLAAAYLASGRPTDAERVLRGILAQRPADIEALGTLAATLEQQDRLGEAVPVFRKMLEHEPGHPRATAGLARALQADGKRAEAIALLRPVFEGERPQPVVVSTFAGLCDSPEDRRACVQVANRLLGDRSIPAPDRAGLCFAAGRLLEKDARFEEAFAFFQQGNLMTAPSARESDRAQLTDELIATFTREAMKALPRATGSSDRPVFILGMPRSGTTLVEQILAAHPEVYAAGELQELRRIWRDLVKSRGGVLGLSRLTAIDVNGAADRYLKHLERLDARSRRVTDKMPHNFEQLGLINLCFPNARVIHCVRDPMDTCVSCYTTQFGLAHGYSTDLGALGRAYGQYRRLMEHWRGVLDVPVLEVVYEELVGDLETHARRIVEHAGLGWDDACLRFYEAGRRVTTASVDQVRRPIYTSSVGRWKAYAEHLRPLREALAGAGVPLTE
jgi:Flp pilus assembly protein TadD